VRSSGAGEARCAARISPRRLIPAPPENGSWHAVRSIAGLRAPPDNSPQGHLTWCSGKAGSGRGSYPKPRPRRCRHFDHSEKRL
jgi:hypothetical protein